jgi:hypothetical protein
MSNNTDSSNPFSKLFNNPVIKREFARVVIEEHIRQVEAHLSDNKKRTELFKKIDDGIERNGDTQEFE